MSDNIRFLIGLTLFVGSLTGCGSSNEPTTAALSGSFALSRLNDRPLPDTEVVLPPAHAGGATCVVLGTSGTLVLSPAARTFLITLNAVNSCGGGEYVFLTETGTYSQQDTVLSMNEPFPDHVETLTGRLHPESVVVHGVYHDYTFDRP